jgi:hypothetical protein
VPAQEAPPRLIRQRLARFEFLMIDFGFGRRRPVVNKSEIESESWLDTLNLFAGFAAVKAKSCF